MKKNFRYLDVIVVLYVVVMLISNIVATKLIDIHGLIIDGGAVLFPLAYILSDVLTEVYGYRHARRAIWLAFGMMLLMVGTFTVVRFLPPAADYQYQAAFEAVLGFLPRIAAASVIAFVVGNFVNSIILAKLKVRTKGRLLWLRLIGSTVLGAAVDTVIFCLVAFGGEIPNDVMVNYILVGIALKISVEVLILPATYGGVAWLKQRESVDTYDKKTNFSPFKFSA